MKGPGRIEHKFGIAPLTITNGQRQRIGEPPEALYQSKIALTNGGLAYCHLVPFVPRNRQCQSADYLGLGMLEIPA